MANNLRILNNAKIRMQDFGSATNKSKGSVDSLIGSILNLVGATSEGNRITRTLTSAYDAMDNKLVQIGLGISGVSKAISSLPLSGAKELKDSFGKAFDSVSKYQNSLYLGSQRLASFGTQQMGTNQAVKEYTDIIEDVYRNSYLTRQESEKLFTELISGMKGIGGVGGKAANEFSQIIKNVSKTGVALEDVNRILSKTTGLMNEFAEIRTAMARGSFEDVGGTLSLLQQQGKLSPDLINTLGEYERVYQMPQSERVEGRGKAVQTTEAERAFNEALFSFEEQLTDTGIAQFYIENSKRVSNFAKDMSKVTANLSAFGEVVFDITKILGSLSGTLGAVRGFRGGGSGRMESPVAQVGKNVISGGLDVAERFIPTIGAIRSATNQQAPIDVRVVNVADMVAMNGGSGILKDIVSGSAGRKGLGGLLKSPVSGLLKGGEGLLGRGGAVAIGSAIAAAVGWQIGKFLDKVSPDWAGFDTGMEAFGVDLAFGGKKYREQLAIKSNKVGEGSVDEDVIEMQMRVNGLTREEAKNRLETTKALIDQAKNIREVAGSTEKANSNSILFLKQIEEIYRKYKTVSITSESLVGSIQKMTGVMDSFIGYAGVSSDLMKEQAQSARLMLPMIEKQISLYESRYLKAIEKVKSSQEGSDREEAITQANADRAALIAKQAEKTQILLGSKKLEVEAVQKEVIASQTLQDIRIKTADAILARNKELRLGLGVNYQDTVATVKESQKQIQLYKTQFKQLEKMSQLESDPRVKLEIEKQAAEVRMKAIQEETSMLEKAKSIREGYLDAMESFSAGLGAFTKLTPKQGFGNQFLAPTPSLGIDMSQLPLGQRSRGVEEPLKYTRQGLNVNDNIARQYQDLAQITFSTWENQISNPFTIWAGLNGTPNSPDIETFRQGTFQNAPGKGNLGLDSLDTNMMVKGVDPNNYKDSGIGTGSGFYSPPELNANLGMAGANSADIKIPAINLEFTASSVPVELDISYSNQNGSKKRTKATTTLNLSSTNIRQ